MKSTLAILAALAIGAGELKADDYREFNQRQAQWQAEFDRDWQEHEQRRYERQQERIQEQNERRFRDFENRINQIYDLE